MLFEARCGWGCGRLARWVGGWPQTLQGPSQHSTTFNTQHTQHTQRPLVLHTPTCHTGGFPLTTQHNIRHAAHATHTTPSGTVLTAHTVQHGSHRSSRRASPSQHSRTQNTKHASTQHTQHTQRPLVVYSHRSPWRVPPHNTAQHNIRHKTHTTHTTHTTPSDTPYSPQITLEGLEVDTNMLASAIERYGLAVPDMQQLVSQ